MKKIIYIEKEIKNSKRVQEIVSRFRQKEIIIIDRYSEVFNKKNQSFKLQKLNPALILAKKYGNFINETPKKYTIGNSNNYYFSYMYNCLFDCKYCFLQGLYSSSNYVIFLNYEDYFTHINNKIRSLNGQKSTFFSGYDCDSLVYDRNTMFIQSAIDFFSNFQNAELEIRTKSTYLSPLLRESKKNIIIASSFTTEKFSSKYEKGVPKLSKRLNFLKSVVNLGWKVGLRFDPFIVYEGCEKDYQKLFISLFKIIPQNQLHSVTYGNLRYPISLYKNIEKNNTNDKLFSSLDRKSKSVEQDNKQFIEEFCIKNLSQYTYKDKIYSNM